MNNRIRTYKRIRSKIEEIYRAGGNEKQHWNLSVPVNGNSRQNNTPNEGNGQELRYERKFFLDNVTPEEIELLLMTNPIVFRRSFRDRYVNNVYFDTEDLACYRDNVNGTSPRKKYRIRYYGDLLKTNGAAVLEIKRKFGMVGDKQRFKVPEINISICLQDGFRGFLSDRNLEPTAYHALVGKRCVLLNRYLRSYFVSADGRYRCTVDRELAFYPARKGQVRTFDRNEKMNLILEMKYAKDLDVRATEITRFFPARVNRVSKYILGVDSLSTRYLI